MTIEGVTITASLPTKEILHDEVVEEAKTNADETAMFARGNGDEMLPQHGVTRGVFRSQAAIAIPVKMISISGCRDDQTSSDGKYWIRNTKSSILTKGGSVRSVIHPTAREWTRRGMHSILSIGTGRQRRRALAVHWYCCETASQETAAKQLRPVSRGD